MTAAVLAVGAVLAAQADGSAGDGHVAPVVVVLAAVAVVVLVAAAVLVARRRRRPPAAGADPDTAVGQVADRVVDRVAERDPGPAAEASGSLRDRLGRARAALAGSLASALDRASTSEEAWTDITEALIRADVGLSASSEIVGAARTRVATGDDEPTQAVAALKAELRERLGGFDRSLARRGEGHGPSVWLFVGVNGTGKTTTIGKLAKRQSDLGARVVLAAGDTFRAAAADQLSMWAERSSAHIVRGAEGADPASVVFDAVESAAARGADLVLADTAGRFHTYQNLMSELQKVRRVAEKGSGVVTETLLVLDATTGQNGLAQARQFTEAVNVTGVVLTKLDGSAKGGIVVSVQTELGVPVKLVGVGEGIADLVPFDESEFVDALFA